MHIQALAFLVALGLAPSARAQTEVNDGAAIGPNWSGLIAEAFFSDSEMTALRPDAELRANWEALPETDRAQVRRDCAAMIADAEDIGGAASGGVSDVDPAETEPAGAQAPVAGESSAGPLGGFPAGGTAAMIEVCALVAGG